MRILTDEECLQVAGGFTEPSSLGGVPAQMPQPIQAPAEGLSPVRAREYYLYDISDPFVSFDR